MLPSSSARNEDRGTGGAEQRPSTHPEQLAYWNALLAGCTHTIDLPAERRTARSDQHQRRVVDRRVPSAIMEHVRRLGRETSSFDVLVSALAVVLGRFATTEEMLIGVVLPGWNDVVPLRINVAPGMSFGDVVRSVRARVREARQYGPVPLDGLLTELGVQRKDGASITQVTLTRGGKSAPSRRPAEIALSIADRAEGTILTLECDDRFGPQTMDAFIDAYLHILECASLSSNVVDDIALSSGESQRELIVASTSTRPADVDVSYADAFSSSWPAWHDHIAVSEPGRIISYGELARRSDALAGVLRERGVGREDVVGVNVDRGVEYVVALLAVLRAGAAFLPLAVADSSRRRADLLRQAGARHVLVERARREHWVDLAESVDASVTATDEAGALSSGDVAHGGETLAYVLFTSGSTGTPKGAMVEQAGMMNHLFAKIDELGVTADDVVAQTAQVSADIAVWQMLAPLLVGGRVAVMPDEAALEPGELAAEGITIWETVPVVLGRCLDRIVAGQPAPARLRVGLSTGEAIAPDLVRRWFDVFPHVALVNAYGPTECSDDVTHHVMTVAVDDSAARVPIGRRIRGVDLYVLDANGRAVPEGFPGELVVGGVAVGRGYLNDADRTAAAFVDLPHSPGRTYRTGDRVRRRDDGALEMLGRFDDQLKLRGSLIEPGEVEAALLDHPDIEAAAVRAFEDPDLGAHLCGYVVLRSAATASIGDLRLHVAERLPLQFVPTRWQFCDQLPVTANGKVDRRALPPLAAATSDTAKETDDAGDHVAQWIVSIWEAILGSGTAAMDADFFDLGGDSLVAAEIVTRIRDELDVRLSIADFVEQPTIANLIATVRESWDGDDSVPLTPGGGCSGPLSAAQEDVWLRDQLVVSDAAYNIAVTILLRGGGDAAAAERALRELAVRHPALRTIVRVDEDDLPFQHVLPAEAAPNAAVFRADGLRSLDAAEALAETIARTPLDPAKAVYRAAVVPMEDESLLAVIVFHHIIGDGWSLGLLVSEFVELYRPRVEREAAPLDEPCISPIDVAVWERELASSGRMRAAADHWQRELTGAIPALPLPYDRTAPPVGASRPAGVLTAQLDRLTGVTDVVAARGSTPFTFFLASWLLVLHRASGASDLTVALPLGHRTEPATRRLVGLLVETVPIRVRIDPTAPFSHLLGAVRGATLSGIRHGPPGISRLLRDRRPRLEPCNTMFVMGVPMPDVSMPGAEVTVTSVHSGCAKFDLTLFVEENTRGFEVLLEYGADVFDASTAGALLDDFREVVSSASLDIAAPVCELVTTARSVDRASAGATA